MARIYKAHLDPLAHIEDLAVLKGGHQLHGGLGVGHGVKGFYRRAAGALALLVLPLGVPLLNEGGVPQHDGHELSCQAGGEDLAGEAGLYQQGDAAGVVDVGMGDDDIVDLAGLEAQGVVIVLVPALLQAAVDQDLFAADLKAVAASGNGVGGAEERQLHSGTS